VLAYGAVGVWTTWPLPARLGHHIIDPGQGPFAELGVADILLVVWALAWDVHALVTAPLGLFDANVFHPARWALARSDHFLGSVPLFAPVYVASGNPVLAHQVALWLTLPLSALAMCLAVTVWTRSYMAGFIAGLCFGFAPWRFGQLGHVQLAMTPYLPLLLLCTWATVVGGSRRAALGVVVFAVWQALCSVYLALAAFAAAGAMLVGSGLAGEGRSWRRMGGTVAALALAAAAVVAVSWPYVALSRTGAIPEVVPGASQLELAAAHPFGTYLLRPRSGSPDGFYFLGWTCAALAALGLLPRRGGRACAAGLALVLVGGWALSLGYGEGTRPLDWLTAVVPSIGSFRAPVRLGVIAATAAAALAGLGYARLEGRLGDQVRWRAALAAAIVTMVLLEAAPGRVALRHVAVGAEMPPVYHWLARQPAGPVLELPVGFLDHDLVGDLAALRTQSEYQFNSTAHWHPLLNGYSGFPPESFYFLMAIARRLPQAEAVRDLVELTGLRWLVVHRGALPRQEQAAWRSDEHPGLVRRALFGNDVVFEVAVEARRDLRPLLRDERGRPLTLAGLPRAPLPSEAMRGALHDLDVPRQMLAGSMQQGTVTVENRSDRPWPGFDPIRHGLVGVISRWHAESGAPTGGPVFTRLARDLAPGERLRLPFAIIAPFPPGRYRLAVTVRQDGGPSLDEAAGVDARATIEVRSWPQR
jgi:hypothetical protein